MTTLKQRLEHWKQHRNNLEAREILEDFADEILEMLERKSVNDPL